MVSGEKKADVKKKKEKTTQYGNFQGKKKVRGLFAKSGHFQEWPHP